MRCLATIVLTAFGVAGARMRRRENRRRRNSSALWLGDSCEEIHDLMHFYQFTRIIDGISIMYWYYHGYSSQCFNIDLLDAMHNTVSTVWAPIRSGAVRRHYCRTFAGPRILPVPSFFLKPLPSFSLVTQTALVSTDRWQCSHGMHVQLVSGLAIRCQPDICTVSCTRNHSTALCGLNETTSAWLVF